MVEVPSEQLEVFRRASKSFSFASRFFSRQTHDDVAELYAYFREIDDLSDQPLSKSHESQWKRLAAQKSELIVKYSLFDEVLNIFEKEMKKDTQPRHLQNDAELLGYCYAVASTVGLSLCRVFQVQEPSAYRHAIDLGIALQLTNICRDVYEDHQNNRIYLPQLSKNDFEPLNQLKIAEVQKYYLKLADEYYQSAYAGLSYLPRRIGFVVYLAAEIYRDIGRLIIQGNDCRVRAYTSGKRKVWLSCRSSFYFLRQSVRERRLKAPDHNISLHRELTGLPFAHE